MDNDQYFHSDDDKEMMYTFFLGSLKEKWVNGKQIAPYICILHKKVIERTYLIIDILKKVCETTRLYRQFLCL